MRPDVLRDTEDDDVELEIEAPQRQDDDDEQRIPDDQGKQAERRIQLEGIEGEQQRAEPDHDHYQHVEDLYDLGGNE